MSRAMTIEEFGKLVEYIKEYNAPLSPKQTRGCPTVKYIDPHFDMRFNNVFSVTLRGFGGEKEFYVMNEFREVKESLFDRIMTYLQTPQF